MTELSISEKIRKEIDDKWLSEMIKKLYYLETKEELSDEEISSIIMKLYFDLGKINNSTDEIAFIKSKLHEYIDIYEDKKNARRIKDKNYKERLAALVGTIILFITLPTGLFIKGKREAKETLFKTRTQECTFNITDNGYLYDGNIFAYRTQYKPINPSDDMVKIIDDGKWQVDGIEMSKKIKTYSLFDISYDEIIASGDIDRYIQGVIPDVETLYTYKNKLREEVRDAKRVYKVVREIQDLSDSITVDGKNKDTIKIIIVLLTELLIMIYLAENNNGFLGEKIMGIIALIVMNNKLTKEEEKVLNELYEKYKNISYLELEMKEKTR